MQRTEAFGGYALVYERALPYLDTRDNDIHVQISFQFARSLLSSYPEANERVVLPAIILHDIGWKLIPEELHHTAFGPNMTRPDLQRLHETEGARLAGEILDTLDDLSIVRDEIVAIIDGHDTRTVALSLNDQIVKDADKLWRFSRRGTAIDSHRFDIPWRDHVEWLGHRIDGWMFTEEGLRLARETLERTMREDESEHQGNEIT
jgi:hypothetical protein